MRALLNELRAEERRRTIAIALVLAGLMAGVLVGYGLQPPRCRDRAAVTPDLSCPVGAYLDRAAPVSATTALVTCRCRPAPRQYAPESFPDDGG